MHEYLIESLRNRNKEDLEFAFKTALFPFLFEYDLQSGSGLLYWVIASGISEASKSIVLFCLSSFRLACAMSTPQCLQDTASIPL